MRCPKCDHDINENMLVCPNCKKVLKLVCPKCKTINKSNTCKKCGFVIISRCHSCGKINQTIAEKCSKCGFNTYTSVAINSSNIDEFACITLEFKNLKDIKLALGSTKLAEKFKSNLDSLILTYTDSIGLSREIIEDIYVIRFSKNDSFKESAINAMKTAVEIQNLIIELNSKLKKQTNTTLKCNIAVLKRDIYSQPNEYKSGFDIKLIYSHQKESSLLNDLQIITDSYIYEQICEDYELNALSAKFIKNEMMTFFELNLAKYIKMPVPKKDEEEIKNLAKAHIFEDNTSELPENEDIYDINALDFNELRCTFTQTKSAFLIHDVLDKFKQNKKQIIALKCEKEFFPETGDLLKKLEDAGIYKNVFRITCHDEMKYKPYGFFYDLITSIYTFSQSTKLMKDNTFDMFKNVDASGFIKDLINLTERTFPHPEDVRYSLFDIFMHVFGFMANSIIYIENFEKIDETSYEVLQSMLENFHNLNVSYLISSKKEFSLHKSSHFLLANPNYTEITVKPTPFKELIEGNIKTFEKILDSYYMQKISQNTKGSLLYFKNAIDYLLEKELLQVEKGTLNITEFENILIPPKLDELIAKRLEHLMKKEKNAYQMFAMLLLIGPSIDVRTSTLFALPDMAASITKLTEKKYIYLYKDTICIQNYNLFKNAFMKTASLEYKQTIANDLLTKVFESEIRHPAETQLYNILEKGKQEFLTWEYLSRVCASMGDFSAYLKCSIKFLKLLDNHVNEDSQKTIEEYKIEVYENISNLLYKYSPNEIHNITQIILENLEKSTDNKKIINLSNKMLQGCLIGGNYSYALHLVHKLLSKFPNASINPQDPNFSSAFFLISLVKIEILFSIGNFKDCIDSGDEILEILTMKNLEKLKPSNLSDKQFVDVISDTMSFVGIARLVLIRNDLREFIEKFEQNIGASLNLFDLLEPARDLIKGYDIKLPQDGNYEEDKFSKILFNIIKAFKENKDNPKKFAGNIYQAKITARMNKLPQIEFICDLLIGYSYFKLGKYKKANIIYYNVLEISTKNGLKLITYLAWYLISMLKFEQKEIEIAFGLANNAIIQLEKNYNSSEFLLFLFRVLMSEILTERNDKKSAELCLSNAKFIKEKHGLNFTLEQSP